MSPLKKLFFYAVILSFAMVFSSIVLAQQVDVGFNQTMAPDENRQMSSGSDDMQEAGQDMPAGGLALTEDQLEAVSTYRPNEEAKKASYEMDEPQASSGSGQDMGPGLTMADKEEVPEASMRQVQDQASMEEGQMETDMPASVDKKDGAEWVWGRVVSVDPDNHSMTIKHIDYDTYEDVSTVLKTNDKTLFENVTSLDDVVIGDHVTVDYTPSQDLNIAGLVVVDKAQE